MNGGHAPSHEGMSLMDQVLTMGRGPTTGCTANTLVWVWAQVGPMCNVSK